jgi:phosphoglycolate phosphatase
MKDKNIKYIFWDWNGTILKDVIVNLYSINAILKERGISPINLEKYKDSYQFPIREFYNKIGLPKSQEFKELISVVFYENYNAFFNKATIDPYTLELLEYFNSIKCQQFIISARGHDELLKEVEGFGLEKYFSRIIGIKDQNKLENTESLINEFIIDINEVLLIGDTISDFEISNKLGINCVLLSDGHQSHSRLKKKTVNVFDSSLNLLRAIV